MFFQISPVRREKVSKLVKTEPEPEIIEVLSLAPFAPSPKLFFDRVVIGETATCKLLVKNPTKQSLTIFLTKKVPDELNVTYSWESQTIEKESEVLFEIYWRPTYQESSYHKISFETTKKTHRDVSIIFKSISPKKAKLDKKAKNGAITRKSPQKSPTKKYYTNRPPNISIAKYSPKYSPSPKKIRTLQKTTPPRAFALSPKAVINKENMSPNARNAIDIDRRGTYTFQRNDDSIEEFNDSLEIGTLKPTYLSTPQIFKERPPLAVYNARDETPDISLGTYFKQKSCKPDSPLNYGFEYKLMQMESFSITTNETPPRIDRQQFVSERMKTIDELDHNLSSDTYIKDNISFETYVKGNLSTDTYTKDPVMSMRKEKSRVTFQLPQEPNLNVSSETYVKGNISGETYTKDSSIAQLDSLSPASTTISPINNARFLDQRQPINNYRQPLWSIEEESSFYNKRKRKNSDLDLTANHAKRGGGFSGPKNWSRKGGTAFTISKNTSGLKLTRPVNTNNENIKEMPISSISKTDSNTVIVQNPFLFAATNMLDPFITPQLYVSDEWLDRQEKDFKKWLNSLLTPPEELLSEDRGVDVAKVWQECKKMEVEAAPTKEEISNKYHVNAKLNTLRKSAQNLFRSKEMNDVLAKVLLAIDKGKLSIRQDKDVHLNLTIKSDIMSTILSYNPLWLRIGLETIYNETIPLSSNSDVLGLGTFILNRLFKDPYLLKKYKSIYTPKYVAEFNKFFLKKYIVLVYFLDQAKNRKLIPHNPCLFHRNSVIKESRELLLKLARELLSAVGDITKFLKFSGYIVSHVQTYIHEFDYAVKNLGVDLRDGVRLTKVMEIITMKEDLTSHLRVPAISRLQKVHNMKLVFDTLEKAGYKILYEISPENIVDGHREKTMSFLWQIIYKFEAPLMVKNATTIQTWFRSLPVVLKRRKLERIRNNRNNAASKIQKWYKRQVLSNKLLKFAEILKQYLLQVKRNRSAVKIQSYYKMYKQRKVYLKQIETIKEIQRLSRGWLVRNAYTHRIKSSKIIQSYVRMFLARKKYLKIKTATVTLQRRYRATKQTKYHVEQYQKLKYNTVFIQQKWRANILARKQQSEYLTMKMAAVNVQKRFKGKIALRNYQQLKSATIKIQNWYRSIKMMQICRQEYTTLKQTVLIIEQRYTAIKTMKKDRQNYQLLKKSSITIQQRYRAQITMKETRNSFIQIRNATVVFQRRFRAKKLMIEQKQRYESLKRATITIQRQYRAILQMNYHRNHFLTIKNAAIKIQACFRGARCRKEYLLLKHATKVVQDRYRAKLLMQIDKENYKNLKNSALTIQTRFRALLAMRQCRNNYNQLKIAAVTIQSRFKANRAMKMQKYNYLELKNAASIIQSRYRAKKEMQDCKNRYDAVKNAALIIQRRYRANRLMKITSKQYRELLRCTVTVQRFFRAKQSMIKERNNYVRLIKAVKFVQARWRANKAGKQQKERYEALRKSAVTIQQIWRGNKMAKIQRMQYEQIRRAVLLVQRQWRANQLYQKARKEYLATREATILIQTLWRAKTIGKVEKERYLTLRKSVLTIQQIWRGNKMAKEQRMQYEQIRSAVLLVQRQWRANKLCQKDKKEYLAIRNASLLIQARWRANKLGKVQKESYLALRKSVVTIQQIWRANKMAQKQRIEYQQTYKNVLLVQRKWRANKLYEKARKEYIAMRKATLLLQTRWRANKLGKQQKERYLDLRKSAVTIQQRWKANKIAQKQRLEYQQMYKSALFVQRQWRANKLASKARNDYLSKKKATLTIQNIWRAKKIGKVQKQNYLTLRKSAVTIQQRWRANKIAQKQRIEYQQTYKSALFVQRQWRAKKLAIKARNDYLSKRKSTLKIQTIWRAKKMGKIQKERYLALRNSAVTIQQIWRANKMAQIQRLEYQQTCKSALFVQRQWRANKLAIKARTEYLSIRTATLSIQSFWRATKLGRDQKQHYLALRKSSITIQQIWRANKMAQKQRLEYQQTCKAALFIQQRWRALKSGEQERREYLSLRKATLVIQARWRAKKLGEKQRKLFLMVKRAVLTIQTRTRATLQMRTEKNRFERTKRAAIIVQKRWREYTVRKIERRNYLTFSGLQRFARGYLIRKKYADYFTDEAREQRRIEKMRNAAATQIQRLWRGYKSRSEENPQLKQIRQRYVKAHASAVPENRIEYKCNLALDTLLNKGATLFHIIKALEDIEYATRRCKKICLNLGKPLAEDLYSLLCTLTRSLPEMTACIASVKILINFNKLDETRMHSFCLHHIDHLITIMMHWCDKESQLFPTLCTLFWLFAHTPQWKRQILNLPNIKQKFDKISGLVTRKQNMVKRQIVKRGSVFIGYSHLPLPSRVPDWGLDYKTKPNVFTNSVHALVSLLSILNM